MPNYVVLDACVIINLIHIDALQMLGSFPDYKFIMPPEAYQEVTRPEQKSVLDKALNENIITQEKITALPELEQYADLRADGRIGKGEAACLALAINRGCYLATDDNQSAVRKYVKPIRESGRLIETPVLIINAIKKGFISVEEADHAKMILEQHNYKMKFESFKDMI